MAYLNKIMLIGNLGHDPEVRISQSTGRKKASFTLATTKRYRDANGEQREQTTWHTVACCGKLADIVEQLELRKGTCLYVEGEMTSRTWDANDGTKRTMYEVNASTFQILTPRGQGAQQGGGRPQTTDYSNGYNPYAPKGGNAAPQQQTMPDYADDDDGLPF